MRSRFLLFLAATLLAGPGAAVADPLSSADRELLLESIDQIRQAMAEKVDARFRVAIAAYREALGSEDAARKFYLQCVEKVEFTDKDKSASDFRTWKKRQDENLSQATMRRALLHQLRWLVLTLKAASDQADMEQLTADGLSAMESIFADKAMLSSQRGLLGQSVTSSAFARAYGIDGVRAGKWPTSPLDFPSFYQELIFPRHRATGDFKSLRAAWTRRIQMSVALSELEPSNEDQRNPLANPRRGERASRGADLPSLLWQMEVDLFRCGDQRQAATNMMEHINRNITSPRIEAWTNELRGLLQDDGEDVEMIGP